LAAPTSCEGLGPPVVRLDDGSVPPSLQWHKNLALLVYLARSPKRARARDHLIGLLWGDEAEKDARHSLNQAVSTLRTYAGESIGTDGTHVRLAAGAVARAVEQPDGRGQALKAFTAFAERLQRDLGAEPDSETRALVDRIRQGRAWHLPETASAPTGPESRRAPLVGRSRELERLVATWATCRGGR